MGGLGLSEILILVMMAIALGMVTVGSRRVREYGRSLGRGRGWDFPAEVLDELEALNARVDVLTQRLSELTDRLDAAGVAELPPGVDRDG